MARQRADRGSKRSRDSLRDDLTERHARAVDVNATPVESETADAKRRRVARRNTARSRFNKAMRELDLLSVEEETKREHDPVEQLQRVVTEQDGQQETKQEEDDVLEHQRRAARQDECTETDTAIAKRTKQAAMARARRANMTASQREQIRAKDAARKRETRMHQAELEREAERQRNRLAHEVHRLRMTQDEQEAEQERNRLAREERRSQQAEDEREAERERNRLAHEVHRLRMTQEEREVERERNRVAREEQREQSVEDEDVIAERRRLARRSVRRGHALINHETFEGSSVTGEHVIRDGVHTGVHKLPATVPCAWCGALKWPGESKIICCIGGMVQLPELTRVPPRLLQLYGDPEFRKNIRAYNQVFAFTSIGASRSDQRRVQPVREDTTVQGQRGVYTYRIQGAMGHYLGTMLPYIDRNTGQPTESEFAQIYVVDPDMRRRAERRQSLFSGLDPVVLLDIEDMMQQINPFAQQFLNFGERLRSDIASGKEVVDIVYKLHANHAQPGTHNLPTVSEVGATLIEDGNLDKHRDILLYARDRSLLRLFETHKVYDPLQYPLLFPHGDLGWTYTDTYTGEHVRRGKRQMSLREHVAFRLFPKMGDGSALHLGGRLFQQWVVDQQAKAEQERLRWVATHQKEIRADLYRGFQDAFINENTTALGGGGAVLSEYDRHFLDQIGRRVILPASHTGSPRYMYKTYQDAMAMVRECGKPDIFLTMTCNPQWEEFNESISAPMTAQDRPDIVARVWQQKLRALLKDLDEGVLGRMLARIYVIEFQKRGLPHAHILIILAEEDKPRSRETIDKLVSAELPDEGSNPGLYYTALACMMHGPCGELNPSCACMKDGKCSKGFPKPLSEITRANQDGYPVYRRRRRSPGVLKHKGREYDNATVNQWVVPYNPYFLVKYNCHINLEVCTSITAVKYLFKYVYKGSDKAVLTVEAVREEGHASANPQGEPNELLRYLNARYISPVEACTHLLDHPIQDKTYSVTVLRLHLPDQQVVHFQIGDNPEDVLRRGSRTMLTAYFELCDSDAPEDQIAKTMYYHDIPKKFTWDGKAIKWIRRKRNRCAIGRLVHVSPRDAERFYLRVMLCHRKGPTSFEDLRTVEGVMHPTFRDAAMHAGYLEHDGEWVACMEEASAFRMPYQLRQLFATLLVYSMPNDVKGLWNRFYEELARDYAHKYRALEGQTKDDMIKFHTLKSLHELLTGSGSGVHEFDLPQLSEFPQLIRATLLENSLIRREMTAYDHNVLQDIVNNEGQLNDGQRAIYNQITQAVDTVDNGNKLFFIDGPGGTGKSTLLRHILAKVRLSGKIAIAVASSGIASLLLKGGRTAHSTFKIPIKLDETSTCSITKQSHLRGLLREASVVIWDEAPMTHRFAFEAVDRTLQDIMDNDQEPFGGKTFVLSGDFRQTLPVVVKGTPAQAIDACIKSSALWRDFKQVHLTENMRVMSAESESSAADLAAFSNWLLQVGEGRHEVDPSLGQDYIKIPNDMLIENPDEGPSDEDEEMMPGVIPKGLRRMIDTMYADINDPVIATDEYFANRTILTTTNAMVHRINEAVADRIEEIAHEYLSADSVKDDEGGLFEQEILHTLNVNGIPPHKLTLKRGAPIMMMRNLSPELGLCNGTRLRVVLLKPHVIHATIMTGERQGQHVLIPRIIFISGDTIHDFPFRLRRKQFPIQPAYAMTINKAQGQTVQNLGLYLSTPCFSHGQLYVAISRVTARSKFKALIEYPEKEEEDGVYTKNIVYRQIFESS